MIVTWWGRERTHSSLALGLVTVEYVVGPVPSIVGLIASRTAGFHLITCETTGEDI